VEDPELNLDNVIQAMRQLPPSATLADIEQCLPQSISAVQEILVDLHQALMCADLSKMASKSKETATHFVWVIADNPTVDSKLCLHQFKSSSEATAGYANTIHNHRYDFASLVLNGGYTEEVYNLDLTKLEVNSIVSLPRPAETRVNVG
jgi:hypothetical protein